LVLIYHVPVTHVVISWLKLHGSCTGEGLQFFVCHGLDALFFQDSMSSTDAAGIGILP